LLLLLLLLLLFHTLNPEHNTHIPRNYSAVVHNLSHSHQVSQPRI